MAQVADESKYPSVDLAYEFVAPSYSWLLKRVGAAERRIETLLTLIAAVTLAIPMATMAMVESTNVSLFTWGVIPGILALACVVVAVSIGLIGRQAGAVTLVDPGFLYKLRLSESCWTFRKNAIYDAGRHFAKNRELVSKKSSIANVMSALLIAEIIAGCLWSLSVITG